MEFLELLKKLEESEEYRKWKAKNRILAHGFTVLNDKYEEAEAWQIGYYDKKKDKITTFRVTPHTI